MKIDGLKAANIILGTLVTLLLGTLVIGALTFLWTNILTAWGVL